MKRSSRQLTALVACGLICVVVIWLTSSSVQQAPHEKLAPVGLKSAFWQVRPLLAVGDAVITLNQGKSLSNVRCTVNDRQSCVGIRRGPYLVACQCFAKSLPDARLAIDGAHVGQSRVEKSVRERAFLGVCSMIRGDDEYLLEWLEFHSLLGVERFKLYSDEPNKNAREATEALLRRSDQVEFVNWWPSVTRAQERQFLALTHCMLTIDAEWVAIIDVDEFLVPGHRNPDNIADAVRQLSFASNNVGSLFVPQLFFGSKPSTKTFGSVLSRFLWREEHAHAGAHPQQPLSTVGKSITLQKAFQSLHTSHSVELKGKWERHVVKETDLRINHYVCKTKTEQSRREALGNSWRSKTLQNWTALCERAYVSHFDDTIVDRFGEVMGGKF